MNRPLISMIVGMYKGEKYIRECIDSVIRQDYTNLEIILVDDGSPDNCGSIADTYAESCSSKERRRKRITQPCFGHGKR